MRKRKGIVLLITLFFISAISVLILQNLDDSEKFINETSYTNKLNQFKVSNKNIQSQIISIVNKNKDYIDEILEYSQSIPLNFGDMDLVINIEYLYASSCNINKLTKPEEILTFCGEEVYSNIFDRYKFIDYLNEIKINGNIRNQEQLDYFLNEYKKIVNDDRIDSVRENFGYFVANEESTYLKCTYDIFLEDGASASSFFVFEVGKNDIENSYYSLGQI